jgi:hypothetical protein
MRIIFSAVSGLAVLALGAGLSPVLAGETAPSRPTLLVMAGDESSFEFETIAMAPGVSFETTGAILNEASVQEAGFPFVIPFLSRVPVPIRKPDLTSRDGVDASAPEPRKMAKSAPSARVLKVASVEGRRIASPMQPIIGAFR